MPLVMPKGKKSRLTVASPENSEAEASPVFAVLVNKEGNLWHRPDVSQSRKPFWYNPLRFPVHCRVEDFAIVYKTDRHAVWSKLRIQARKPCNPGIFQFRLNRVRNRLLLARHVGSPELCRWVDLWQMIAS